MIRPFIKIIKVGGALGAIVLTAFAYHVLGTEGAMYIGFAVWAPIFLIQGFENKYDAWCLERERLDSLSPVERSLEAIKNSQFFPVLVSMVRGAFLFLGASILVLLAIRLMSVFI